MGQVAVVATQRATMLASELNAANVEVSEPFGVDASTVAMSPVVTSTRSWATPTAFGSPGDGPESSSPCANCVMAYAVATVVRSLTTTSVGTASGPRTAANVTAPDPTGESLAVMETTCPTEDAAG